MYPAKTKVGSTIVKSLPIVALLIIGAGCVYYRCTDSPKLPIQSTTSILRIDSVLASSDQAKEHNMRVLHNLEVTASISANLRVSREDSRMQARLFYSAILAGLASLLISKKEDNPIWIALLLLGVIAMMYMIDVHLADLDARNVAADNVTHDATIQLINLEATDSTQYKLDHSVLIAEIDSARAQSLSRKLHAAFRPEIEQILYYVIPMALVFLSWCWFTYAKPPNKRLHLTPRRGHRGIRLGRL